MRIILSTLLLGFSLTSLATPVLDRAVQTAQYSAFAEALNSQSRIPLGATIKSISVAHRFNLLTVFFTRQGQNGEECLIDSGEVMSKEVDGKTVYTVNFSRQPATKVNCQ